MSTKKHQQRKQKLGLNFHHYHINTQQLSDPIVKHLLQIIQWQLTLDIKNNQILHNTFIDQLQQIKCKLKLTLKQIKYSSQGIQYYKTNLEKFVNQYLKVKQMFIFCLILQKQQNEIQKQVQKYKQYKTKQQNLPKQLQTYLNQPIIFKTIFTKYSQIYNTNILTKDLIKYIYEQYKQNILIKNIIIKQQYNFNWYHHDLLLLKNQKIVFKSLVSIYQKYTQLNNQAQYLYVRFLCNGGLGICQGNNKGEQEGKVQCDHLLKEKVRKLEKILAKVRKEPCLYSNEQASMIEMESEPLCNFSVIGMSCENKSGKVFEESKQFLLKVFYNNCQDAKLVEDEQFSFMRQKIVKIQTLYFFNRILSAMNVISYIYNQLDLQIRQNNSYTFKNLQKLLDNQFITDQYYSYTLSKNSPRNAFISTDTQTQSYNIIDTQNIKILYPSAIYYFFGFIKNILYTLFQNKQIIIQILQNYTKYVESLAQVVINIYQMVKSKQLSCYQLLRKYIEIMRKSQPWNNFNNKKSHEVLEKVVKQKQKVGVISQIVYQFNRNYSIKQLLKQLIRIEFDGLTKNCLNTYHLYKTILSQILQIRNGLKLDHYYSLNQLHQKFSLIPKQFSHFPDDLKINKQNFYFQDIIHQICLASAKYLYLPNFFKLIDLQIKFKRIVFQLELYWSCHSNLMFDSKLKAFINFVDGSCSPIFQIVKECHSIADILEKVDEIQKNVQLFQKEVAKFQLIQRLGAVTSHFKGNDQANIIKQHARRLPVEILCQLNAFITSCNQIEGNQKRIRCQFIQQLCNNIKNYSAIKVQQLKNFDALYEKQKDQLSSIIVILNMISSRNLDQDYQSYIEFRFNGKTNMDAYQMRQKQSMKRLYEEWLNTDNLSELVKFNENLLVLGILRTLRQVQSESQQTSKDVVHLQQLMGQFQLSKVFTNFQKLTEMHYWQQQFGITTKYHKIYKLIYIISYFNETIFTKPKNKIPSINTQWLNLINNDYNKCLGISNFITKLYNIFQLSPLIRTILQKHLQQLQQQILGIDSIHRHCHLYNQKLKGKIYQMFCLWVQDLVDQLKVQNQINGTFDISKSPLQHIENLNKVMINALEKECKKEKNTSGYGKERQIQTYKKNRGYEIVIQDDNENKQYRIVNKTHIDRPKKALIPFQRFPQQKQKQIQNIRQKYKIQKLKKTLQIRKYISKLQLNQNQIRDQIIWQTSKLQYSVIDKIKQFITLSNVDQQQSYLNFKHTVNLQTIKGIQNVINQQTQMFIYKQNSPLPSSPSFITTLQIQNPITPKSTLLQTNIDSILNHMKKIKIFASWKKSMKKNNLIQGQWNHFNHNVSIIFNNQSIFDHLTAIYQYRNHYLHSSVICEIIQEQNKFINHNIQLLRIDNLDKKVRNYRESLLNQ